MKSLITTLLTLGLLVPTSTTYAFSLDDLIEAAKNGNGTYVETHSSASTGGQHASSGESVKTGDVSASSHVETNINAGSNGGNVQVKIETSQNGETKTEEYSAEVDPKKGVKVEAHASASDGDYESEINVNDEPVETNTTVESNAQVASAGVAFQSKISLLFSEQIPRFFKKAISFLWRW